MRDERSGLRGESRRVAERTRALLAAADQRTDELPEDPEPAPSLADRMAARLPARLDPGRRPVLLLAAVAAVVAVVAGLWVVTHRPDELPVPASSVASASPLVRDSGRPSPSRSGPSAGAVASRVVVDVAGKVRRPGLYRLPAGSRVDDAIRAAGGPLRGVDLSSLNLAAPLVDGQQIAVGRPGAVVMPGGPPSAGTGGATASGALVNLNTATQEQLEGLPGIGPALAGRILDYRTEHGSFASVDQLDDVSGIGSVTFARLKPLVTV